MRDYVLLYINGKEHRVRGKDVFIPLSDYLRSEAQATGTKVVCAEGDCGACSVFIGRADGGGENIEYAAVNSCIQFVFQVDGAHVVTVEGLKVDGELNKVQEAMVDCHGAQCGYCTPGFIVSMCAMFESECGNNGVAATRPVDAHCVKDALTGNLCRCTGYDSIIKACLSVDASRFKRLNEIYPPQPILKELVKHRSQTVEISTEEARFSGPVDVKGAVAFKSKYPDSIIVSGGTDVCVNVNKKGFEPKGVISLSNVTGLNDLKIENGWLVAGARVTLRELELFLKERIPELHNILWMFGSPQIRQAATLAGNIANASPIADTIPFLFVMEAEVDVEGSKGPRRIAIEKLYTGYKQLSLKADEIITRIQTPLPVPHELFKLYKVSRRQHLDISSFTAAIRLQKDGDVITSAAVAYGGVAPVVVRLPETEAFLMTRNFTVETFREAGRIARREIKPISDVRGSADFRLQLAENILSKFYYETAQERDLVCLK